jgi:hypothetical protein
MRREYFKPSKDGGIVGSVLPPTLRRQAEEETGLTALPVPTT